MITDNIKTHSRFIVLNLGTLKKRRVEKIISAIGECKFEPVLLTKAEKYVKESAAGCFVGLHEHDVHFWRARLSCALLRHVCGKFVVEMEWAMSTRVRHWNIGHTNGDLWH